MADDYVAIKIRINFTGSAFRDHRDAEIARILRKLADKLKKSSVGNLDRHELVDAKGYRCGSVSVIPYAPLSGGE